MRQCYICLWRRCEHCHHSNQYKQYMVPLYEWIENIYRWSIVRNGCALMNQVSQWNMATGFFVSNSCIPFQFLVNTMGIFGSLQIQLTYLRFLGSHRTHVTPFHGYGMYSIWPVLADINSVSITSFLPAGPIWYFVLKGPTVMLTQVSFRAGMLKWIKLELLAVLR